MEAFVRSNLLVIHLVFAKQLSFDVILLQLAIFRAAVHFSFSSSSLIVLSVGALGSFRAANAERESERSQPIGKFICRLRTFSLDGSERGACERRHVHGRGCVRGGECVAPADNTTLSIYYFAIP